MTPAKMSARTPLDATVRDSVENTIKWIGGQVGDDIRTLLNAYDADRALIASLKKELREGTEWLEAIPTEVLQETEAAEVIEQVIAHNRDALSRADSSDRAEKEGA